MPVTAEAFVLYNNGLFIGTNKLKANPECARVTAPHHTLPPQKGWNGIKNQFQLQHFLGCQLSRTWFHLLVLSVYFKILKIKWRVDVFYFLVLLEKIVKIIICIHELLHVNIEWAEDK